MSAPIPTFREVLLRARRERREITEVVLMADDTIARICFGPRGGWRLV